MKEDDFFDAGRRARDVASASIRHLSLFFPLVHSFIRGVCFRQVLPSPPPLYYCYYCYYYFIIFYYILFYFFLLKIGIVPVVRGKSTGTIQLSIKDEWCFFFMK